MELRILGPIELVRDGRPVELGPPKERTLLALLAIRRGEVVSVDLLAQELWDGDPPGKAAGAIQVYVSHLRKALHASGEQVLLTKQPGYILDLDPQRIDASRFVDGVDEARKALGRAEHERAAATAREALALWRGPALADALPDHPAAVRLNELRVSALDVRIEAELGSGSHETLVAELEALTTQYPLYERLWGHRMLALYRAGRQADALAVYQKLRETLSDELGIDPGPELQRLEQAILRQDPSLAAPAPPAAVRTNLRSPLTAFVGRARELQQLEGALSRARLLTVVGLGGTGKSRLALEVARARVAGGEDAWQVQLEPVADADLHLPAIARAVGAAEQQGLGLTAAVVAAIGARPAVLLLDGCEQAPSVVADIAEILLGACPSLRIVATSRVPLDLPGEAVWRLPPMDQPDAVALFEDRARLADPAFALDGADAAASLVSALDLIPLAVELAAAHASVLTVEQIADRLIIGPEGDDAGPHAAVRAALAWSFDRLAPDERIVLRRLGVFAGGFTLEDAEAVCADEHLARPQMLPLVARLSGLGLLGAEARDGRKQYVLLHSVRGFALERLHAADEGEAVARRHAEHYLTKVRTGAPGDLDHDQDNIHVALGWAVEHEPAWGLSFAIACGPMWTIRSRSTEGRRWLARALGACDLPPTDQTVMGAHLLLGSFTMDQGEIKEAKDSFEQVLDAARSIADRSMIARATLNLGVIAHHGGDMASAQERHREALGLARELGEDHVAMRALNNLGLAARIRADFDEASALFGEAVALAKRLGDPPTIVSAQMNLSNVVRARGDVRGARTICDEALATARAAGFARGIAACVGTLGMLALAEGDIDAADEAFAETLQLARDAGEKMIIAATLGNLAAVAGARGEHRVAEAHGREFLALAEELDDRRAVAQASLVTAEALVLAGAPEHAGDLLRRSLRLRAEADERDGIAESLEGMALLHAAGGDREAAGMALGAAERLRAEIGAPRDGVRERSIGAFLAAIEGVPDVDVEALVVELVRSPD